MNQYQNNKSARKILESLFDNPRETIFIHYSCESFINITGGRSPRVTTIALRFLGSGQTKSFSIHHEAELNGALASDLDVHYDKLEKKFLEKFYRVVKQYASCKWMHWNMRDANYGFEAIAHRYKVLGGKPIEILDSNKFDLARLMHDLLGRNYIEHPRLQNLLIKNDMVPRSFMSGKDEAEAFEKQDFLKLHQSTLSKVDVLMDLATAAHGDRLVSENNYFQRRGLTLKTAGAVIKEHPGFLMLTVISVVLALIYNIFRFFK